MNYKICINLHYPFLSLFNKSLFFYKLDDADDGWHVVFILILHIRQICVSTKAYHGTVETHMHSDSYNVSYVIFPLCVQIKFLIHWETHRHYVYNSVNTHALAFHRVSSARSAQIAYNNLSNYFLFVYRQSEILKYVRGRVYHGTRG